MSSTNKELVKSFYTSDFYKKPEEIKNFLHQEAQLYWNSSSGFNKMSYDDICEMSKGMSKSFDSLRADISHLLSEGDEVSIRFTYHIRTVENSDEEIPLGHFISIWKIKDGKLFKGYQISQPADETPENLGSFIETNF